MSTATAHWHWWDWDAYLNQMAREVAALRPMRTVIARETDAQLHGRLTRLKRKALREQLARARKAQRAVAEQARRTRWAVREQTINLLRFSELSYREIGERMQRLPDGVARLQVRRQIKRPITVHGRWGYDRVGRAEMWPPNT